MDYPKNSHRVKEEQSMVPAETRKKIEPVTTGVVKTKKKTELSKLVNVFISEDAPTKIKAWVMDDVFIPALKKAVMGSLDMLIKGGHSSGYTPDYSSKPKIKYSQFSNEPSYQKATSTVLARDNVEYPDIEYPSRGAAERVLISMHEIHREFKNVSLAELFELSKVDHPYTYTKYGWTSLDGVDIIRRGDGYFIKLPPATLITNR